MVKIYIRTQRYDEKEGKLIIENIENKEIEDKMNEYIIELDEFFGFKLKETPTVNIVPDRKTINYIRKAETRSHTIGWISGYNVFMLDLDKFDTESAHKRYSLKEYFATIKHELVHVYFYQLIKNPYPTWLWEGTSVALSGQYKPKPEKLSGFLESHFGHNYGPEYMIAPFFVKVLINKYGRDKFILLLNELSKIKQDKTEESKKVFYDLFQRVYEFELNYENANKLFLEK